MRNAISVLSSTILVAVLFGLVPPGIRVSGLPLPLLAAGLAAAGILLVIAGPARTKRQGRQLRRTAAFRTSRPAQAEGGLPCPVATSSRKDGAGIMAVQRRTEPPVLQSALR